MHIKLRTRRARAVIAGALLAGALSVGAVAGTASADESDSDAARVVKVQLDDGGSQTFMRGGIRW